MTTGETIRMTETRAQATAPLPDDHQRPFLEMRGISKSFLGVRALTDGTA